MAGDKRNETGPGLSEKAARFYRDANLAGALLVEAAAAVVAAPVAVLLHTWAVVNVAQAAAGEAVLRARRNRRLKVAK